MTYSLDFALFYVYSLALVGFVLFWLAPKLVRLVLASGLPTARIAEAQQAPQLPPSTETRFDAFTRL